MKTKDKQRKWTKHYKNKLQATKTNTTQPKNESNQRGSKNINENIRKSRENIRKSSLPRRVRCFFLGSFLDLSALKWMRRSGRVPGRVSGWFSVYFPQQRHEGKPGTYYENSFFNKYEHQWAFAKVYRALRGGLAKFSSGFVRFYRVTLRGLTGCDKVLSLFD